MIFAVDFDLLALPHDYAAETVPLRRSAVGALKALKAAGHILILTSPRASRALRLDPTLDPLVRAGVRSVDRDAWERAKATHRARYAAMLAAVKLLGVFDAIDDGEAGPVVADLRLVQGSAVNGATFGLDPIRAWYEVARTYGEIPSPGRNLPS